MGSAPSPLPPPPELHSCAVNSTGQVLCWGWGVNGQLGDGFQQTRTYAVHAQSVREPMTKLSAGSFHTCGMIRDKGTVMCWGLNVGQIGDGTNGAQSTVGVAPH